jgi:hypothetical protein
MPDSEGVGNIGAGAGLMDDDRLEVELGQLRGLCRDG